MGTPIEQTESLEDFFNRRKQYLMESGSLEAPTSAPTSTPQEKDDGNLVMKGLKGGFNLAKAGINKLQDIREQNLAALSPEDRALIESVKPTSDPGLLQHASPGGISSGVGRATRVALDLPEYLGKGANTGTMAGRAATLAERAGLARRFSPFRSKGVKLAEAASKGRSKSFIGQQTTAIGQEAADAIMQRGANIWSKNLEPGTISDTNRLLRSIPESEQAFFQQGMIQGLKEQLSNMTHLSKTAQQNLLSPAGRARLAATFEGYPPEAIEHFMRMVEKGQFQNITRWMTLVPFLIPAVRNVGYSFIRSMMGD